MLLSQLAVVLCMAALSRHGFSTQFSFDRCRRAHDQGSGGDILSDHSSCCNQCASSNGDPIENNGADADEAAVVE